MENVLNDFLIGLTLEQLSQTSIGEKLQQAADVLQSVQNHFFAFTQKQDELDLLGVKAATIAAFAILRKIGEGKAPACFSQDDWKDVAVSVSQYAALADDTNYSVSIFGLYERYIRFGAQEMKPFASPAVIQSINALADDLHLKAQLLQSGNISEVQYTEDCLWISLEAMVKLLASTASFLPSLEMAAFSQAMASFAFSYGRLMLYRKEQELVYEFLQSQHRMDETLAKKYDQFLAELIAQSAQFYGLIDHAFAPDFREAFLQSILLAKAAGVQQDEILSSQEDVDQFFLD